MGTVIVPVRRALMDALGALSAFADVETVYAYKVGSVARQRAWTQDARFTHASAGMRAVKTFRNEAGSFNVVIRVEGVGKASEDTGATATAIGLALEDWVATKAHWAAGTALANVGVEWIEVSGDGRLVDAFNDQGSLVDLIYPIRYSARLT